MVLFLQSIKSFRYIPENESEQDILGWNTSCNIWALKETSTSPNKKRYSGDYRSRRDIKEKATSHRDDEEEEDNDSSKNPKLEIGDRNGNAFVRTNNGKVV